MKTRNLFILICIVMILSAPAFAEDEKPALAAPEFGLEFQTFAIYKNDSDFDRTEPLYDENGYSVGYVSTIFTPTITWRPIDAVTLRYTVEIGDNIWSRNNPDQENPAADDAPILRHKEIWGEVLFPGEIVGLKAGYQYLYDPTHLFIDRYMGAADLFFRIGKTGRLSLLAGQIPDSVYEGIDALGNRNEREQNNFDNDDYLFALDSGFQAGDTKLSPGLFFRWDKSEIDRPMALLAACFNVNGKSGGIFGYDFDIVGQWGRHKRAGLGNKDVEHYGGAAQLGFSLALQAVGFDWNFMTFTADDGNRYDQSDTGFVYSGWSKGRTVLLTENWLRDQYDNLDETAAAQEAGFFVADQDFSIHATQNFTIMIIAGYAIVTDDTNTHGNLTIGTEVDGGVEWRLYGDHVVFNLLSGALFPGESGAMLKNDIDTEATDPIYHGQGSMKISF